MITEGLAESEQLYDMFLLKDLARGNDEFILSLVKIFIQTIPQNSLQMVEAAEDKHWDKVSKIAHKLKSTIDTLQIQSIKQDIRLIEINAKNKADLISVLKQVKKVHQVIEKTSFQLQQQFGL